MEPSDNYRKVISLGDSCETAYHIREFVDQDEAYVFDWVIAPPGAVATAVVSDFSDFLRPENLTFVDRNATGRPLANPHIYDRSARIEFHHDFSNTAEFMSTYDNVAGKFAFLIDRFRREAQGGPILFVQHCGRLGEMKLLDAALAHRFPNLDFKILLVSVAGDAGDEPAGGRILHAVIPGTGTTWQERSSQWGDVFDDILASSFRCGSLKRKVAPPPDTALVEELAPEPEPARSGRSASPSWIVRRRDELVGALKLIAAKERLVVTQPFFQFDGVVPDCDILWADDLFFRNNADSTCDIFFNQGYPNDCDRIRYVRETGRATICATWFWDNHHMFAATMRAAMISDVHFHAHNYMSSYITNELSLAGGFVALCPIFWTSAVVAEGMERSLLSTRSDELYGGYNSYPEFPARDVLLKRLIDYIPANNIFITPHGTQPDQHRFYGMTPLQRLEELMHYKVSLCMSFAANTAIRIFDTLLAGGIPLIVGRPADLDQIFLAHDRESLPIVVVDSHEPELVLQAYRQCLELFDAGGADGVLRRTEYTRRNHMPANRMAQMISKIRAIAADADDIDRFFLPTPNG